MKKLIVVASIILLGVVVGCGKSRNETLPMSSSEVTAAPVILPILMTMRGQGSAIEFVEPITHVEGAVEADVVPVVPAKEKSVEFSFNFSKSGTELTISDYSLKMGEELVDSKNSQANLIKYEEQEEADDVLVLDIDRDLGEGKGIRYTLDGFLSDSIYRFQYLEYSLIQDENKKWIVESPTALFSSGPADKKFEIQKVVEEEKKEEVTKSEEVAQPEEVTTVEGEVVHSDESLSAEVITIEESKEGSSQESVEESK